MSIGRTRQGNQFLKKKKVDTNDYVSKANDTCKRLYNVIESIS